MKRLRTLRFRSYVLPLILAALAARAFMPSGFMSSSEGPAGSTVIQTKLCSFDQERKGRIEFPDEHHDRSSCDHCLSPMGNSPIAMLDAPSPVLVVAQRVRELLSQITLATVHRTQLARAPPRN